MHKKLLMVVLSAALLGLGACRSDGISVGRAVEAGKDLHAAITVSDAELIIMSQRMRDQGDRANQVATAGSKYSKRLSAITSKLKNEDGLALNFKAYVTDEVNANATADGSVRVYSGLMDMMTDDELFFVIGHEIGHVKDGDSLDAVRTAYATSAARKGAGMANSTAAAISDSMLGDMLETVINAQFSQKQENDADAYGYRMMKKYGKSAQAAVSALNKLAALGTSGGLTASHPNSADRAKHIESLIASGK